ncbi:MAG: caspase family protein [Bacteroidetes bacterium]|nr:caspase family protein [Bacteroidota bacterium]
MIKYNVILIFTVLFLLPFSGYSQNASSIIVLPENNSEICFIQTKDRVLYESIIEISNGFKRHNFKVVNFLPILNQIKTTELCNNPDELVKQIIAKSGADIYITADVNPVKTSSGNYVSLTLNIWETSTKDFLTYGSAKSNKFNTTNYTSLTKRAFEKVFPGIESELLLKTGKQEEIVYNKPGRITTADIDINIPLNTTNKSNRYALIIGNEDYKSFQTGLANEANVEFAENDARMFKKYTYKTLGVPEENIILLINARAIEMHQALEKMRIIAKSSAGNAELIFYYAGHGLPDEKTKEPFLIPVDVTGTNLQFAVKLKDVYSKLTEHPSKRVTVFLDACFSGGARNQGLISARAVKITPKQEMLKGSVIVFSASSGDQSSLPYREKQHGIFTYFLLKKLQTSKGNLTYGELSDYISEHVGIKSALINNKEQIPQTNVSPDAQGGWREWKLY